MNKVRTGKLPAAMAHLVLADEAYSSEESIEVTTNPLNSRRDKNSPSCPRPHFKSPKRSNGAAKSRG